MYHRVLSNAGLRPLIKEYALDNDWAHLRAGRKALKRSDSDIPTCPCVVRLKILREAQDAVEVRNWRACPHAFIPECEPDAFGYLLRQITRFIATDPMLSNPPDPISEVRAVGGDGVTWFTLIRYSQLEWSLDARHPAYRQRIRFRLLDSPTFWTTLADQVTSALSAPKANQVTSALSASQPSRVMLMTDIGDPVLGRPIPDHAYTGLLLAPVQGGGMWSGTLSFRVGFRQIAVDAMARLTVRPSQA